MGPKILLNFKDLPWEETHKGLKQKVFYQGSTRLRLMHIDHHFVEEDYCTNGHLGFIVEGEMKLILKNQMIKFEKGDGLCLNAGDDEKHKVSVEKGKFVRLILFENN
tara:strand:+ start:16 stop:336 length:321 start_codon:yes stop_codon:yes gene_type:complete